MSEAGVTTERNPSPPGPASSSPAPTGARKIVKPPLSCSTSTQGDGLVVFQRAGTEAVERREVRTGAGGTLRLPLGDALKLKRGAPVLTLLGRCRALARFFLCRVAGPLRHPESLTQALGQLSNKASFVHWRPRKSERPAIDKAGWGALLIGRESAGRTDAAPSRRVQW